MGTWAVMVLSFRRRTGTSWQVAGAAAAGPGEGRDFKPVISEPDGPASSYVFLPLVAASEQRLIALERRRYCEMVLSHGQGSARRLSLVQKHEMMRMMSAGTEAVQDLKRGDAIRVVGALHPSPRPGFAAPLPRRAPPCDPGEDAHHGAVTGGPTTRSRSSPRSERCEAQRLAPPPSSANGRAAPVGAVDVGEVAGLHRAHRLRGAGTLGTGR